MANIKYRFTMTPESRASSTIKGTPLTYAELDTNFKLIDQDLDGLKDGSLIEDDSITSSKLTSTGVTAGNYGGPTQVSSVSINDKGQVTSASEESIEYPVNQVKTAVYSLNEDIINVIPLDDTIPQSTEGTEILTLSITPISATNKLVINLTGFGSAFDEGHIVYAIFRDTSANAIAAGAVYVGWPDKLVSFSLANEVVAGSTTETVFKVRIGPDITNTISLNGDTNTRFLGGVSACLLTVTEVTG